MATAARRAAREKNARAAADQDAEESDAVQDRAGSGREARVSATWWKNARAAAKRDAGSMVVAGREGSGRARTARGRAGARHEGG